jgi:hypothetical protein
MSTLRRPDLPPLVARYLERILPPDALPTRVRFTQEGEMQLKPGRWMRFEARQEASAERVEFSWRARFPVAPLVALRVDDWFRAGDGALEVRLFGVPLKRIRGGEVSKGEAMRYLAELPWVPHALVGNRELEWRQLDEATAEVATRLATGRAAMRLHFNDAGDIVAASASDRPRAVGNAVTPTPFAGEFSDYEVLEGVRIPTTAEVRWELEDGPFTYFRGRITSFDTA